MGKLTDLDAMDVILDEHFSDDRMIRAIATRSNTDWHEKNTERLKDPEYKSRFKKSMQTQTTKLNNDPAILKKRSEKTKEFWTSEQGIQTRSQQQKKNWEKHRESMQQGLKDRYIDGKLGDKISQALKNSDACKENGKRHRNKIQTPDGIFESRKAAAEHYKVHPTVLNGRMKRYPEQYYYVEVNNASTGYKKRDLL